MILFKDSLRGLFLKDFFKASVNVSFKASFKASCTASFKASCVKLPLKLVYKFISKCRCVPKIASPELQQKNNSKMFCKGAFKGKMKTKRVQRENED